MCVITIKFLQVNLYMCVLSILKYHVCVFDLCVCACVLSGVHLYVCVCVCV